MQHELLFFLLPVISIAGVWISSRFGHFAGGQFAALPTVAGPTSFLLATQIGTDAAIAAAVATLMGGVAVEAMFVTYSRLLVKDVSIVRTTLLSLAVYLFLSALLTGLNWKSTTQSFDAVAQVLLCVAIIVVTTFIGMRLAKSSRLPTETLNVQCSVPQPSLPDRCSKAHTKKFYIAVIVSVAISLLTLGALVNLGPFGAGMVMGFPVISYCGMVLSQATDGRPAAQKFIHGRCAGRMSYQIFFLAVIVLLPHMNIVMTYATAVLVCIFVRQSAEQVKRKLTQGLVL
jgi:hypothetical protein